MQKFIIGIYHDHKQLVVRKFEVISGIRICLDEQYVLNPTDAVIVQNNIIRDLYFKTNPITPNLYNNGK